MNRPAAQTGGRGLAALRRFVDAGKAPEPERCDLCATVIAGHHQHLADPQNRRLFCACDACAILFSDGGQTKLKRVPRDGYLLTGFKIDDQLWNGLGIPTGLVFFFRSSTSNRITALYPSPAGPAEAEVAMEDWEEIVRDCGPLRDLTPDVEALLVNRMKGAREYFVAPIDQCYSLTGLIKKYWRGFSGGEQAWEVLNGFFEELRRRSRSIVVRAHAGH